MKGLCIYLPSKHLLVECPICVSKAQPTTYPEIFEVIWPVLSTFHKRINICRDHYFLKVLQNSSHSQSLPFAVTLLDKPRTYNTGAGNEVKFTTYMLVSISEYF